MVIMKCGLWTSFLPGLSRDGGASIQMPRSVLEHALLPKQVDLSNV